MPARTTVASAALVASLALAGCNDDGRTLPPAPEVPDQVATIPPSTVAEDATAPLVDGPGSVDLALSVEGLAADGSLDPEFTCDGIDVHPRIVIGGVPFAAAELALVVRDLDAEGILHWVVAGIPATTAVVEAGVAPPGGVAARNAFGVAGWTGPCPPEGDGPHRYEFAVHVLAEPIGLAPDLPGEDAAAIVDRSSIDVATVVVTYER